MTTSDSGLQLSMRLLLGIIAGLLISDLLKALVVHFRNCGTLYFWRCPNALVVGAAAIFLFRVVADNMLYYADADPLSTSPSYVARVMLILLDLVSYAFCYDVVSRLDPTNGAIAEPDACGVVADIMIVEALHWIWCYVALDRVRVLNNEDNVRISEMLWNWRFLSGASAVMWFLVWIHLLATPTWPEGGKAILLFTLSACSAVAYVVVMRQQYLAARESAA